MGNIFRTSFRRWIALFPVAIFYLFFDGVAVAVDLSEAERNYLQSKENIIFVSQSQYPPFEFVDGQGQHQGMMLDVVNWLAIELGFRPVFRDMTFIDAQNAVASGEADVITSLFFSEQREKKFSFTQPLFEVPASIFVNSRRPDLRELQDLQGKTIAIQKGDYAKEFLESQRIQFTTLNTANFAEATDKVIQDRADAVIGDEQIVLYHVYKNRLTDRVKSIGDPLYVGKNCMASSKDNALLISILNKGIHDAKDKGVLEKIGKKWLGTQYRENRSLFSRYWLPFSLVSGALLLLMGGIWTWNIRLRSLVNRKTQEIQEREKALRESEGNFRSFFDTIEDVIVVSDTDGKIFYVNPAAVARLGYTREKLLSSNLKDIHCGGQKGEIQSALAAVSRGETISCPLPLQHSSGAGIPADSRGWLGKWNDRDCIFCLSKDLSAEQEALEKFNTLFSGHPTSMVVSKLCDSSITDINSAFLRTFGFTRDEVSGKSIEELGIFTDKKDYIQIVESLKKNDVLNDFGFAARCKGGSSLSIQYTGSKIEAHGQDYLLSIFVDDTQRRIAEKDLKESEEKYRVIFNNEIYAICIFDITTLELLDINDAYCNLYGYSREELLSGMTVHDITAEKEVSDRATRKADKEGAIFIPLRYHRKKDGTVFPVEIVGGPYAWNGRKVMFALAHDITDRKSAENELVEILREKQVILDTVNIGIVKVVDRQLVWGNQKVLELFGYSLEEFEGIDTSLVYASEESYVEIGSKAYSILEKGEAYDSEQLMIGKDGSPLMVRLIGRAIDPHDASKGSIWLLEDISERKKVEQALQKSEQRLSLAMRATQDAIWDYDLLNNSLYYSSQWWAQIGYEENELENDPLLWRRVMHPDDQERADRVVEQAISQETSFEIETRLQHKDGHYVPILTRGYILRDADNIAIRLAGTNTDLTERKLIEKERRYAFRQKQQLEKTESLNRMAGAIAHNFNNILTVVLGNLELALTGNSQNIPVKYLKNAKTAAEKAAKTSKLMLTYLGQSFVEYGVTDLSALCIHISNKVSSRLPKEIFLKTSFQEPGPKVKANTDQLQLMITNLVDNAIEASHEGEMVLILSVKTVDLAYIPVDNRFPLDWVATSRKFAMIAIEDSGSAIPEENINQIFDPFYSTKFAGRGLGLSVALGIVRAHNGVITVASGKESGTVFKVFLPLASE